MVSSEKKTALLMGFGSVMVVLGAVMVVYWPAIFLSQLKTMMILTNVSRSYNIWRETPIPMYLEFHMFNITNVNELLARNDTMLRVREMGPYVFRETHHKANITWNDNSTVTFYNQRWWHFAPELSNGSLSDELTSINPVLVSAGYESRRSSAFVLMGLDALMRHYHSNMFLTANVSSWLFDGMNDDFLTAVRDLPFVNTPYDKFGWFYTRNGSMTYDGVFNMNTGSEQFSSLGNVERWRHSDRTHYRGECGAVRGSTGELWAPELGQQQVEIFAPDICTYLVLSKNRTVEIEGIEGVLYSTNDSTFDNGHRHPETECYCEEPRDADCLPSGTLNVSLCQHGAPAFVSLPHFLHADPYYPSKIDGLAPKQEHNFQLALEMYTGMPLSVSAQLQINLLVRHMTGLPMNNMLPDSDTLVPMFWFRQEVRITPEYARQARLALSLRYGVPYAFYAITAIGVALLVVGIGIMVRRLLRTPEGARIIDSEDVAQ